jgi:predicted ATPase/class 3 adenylate cyclase/Tfp pilus assembly protein PilF
MPELPRGTVTFLFTDIEGSTARWERQPEAMQAALTRHDELLRRAIESHGGAVFKTVGDAFCAAFATAPDALAAAINAQRALATEGVGSGERGARDDGGADVPAPRSPLPAPLRVRMALHTGAAEQRDADYFGPPLNRVARLLSAGHGGQVLLSQAVFDLVRDCLPVGVTLRDLGEHRLKDLIRPERVYQVMAPGLPADFPPLRSLESRPHNLPVQATPLIGREQEVEEVKQRLLRPDVRLLTLTGPGGTGKTRLSLNVAAELLDHFADGVFFVPLAPITDPSLVITTIAQTLGVRKGEGRSADDAVQDFLRDKRTLLVLDNFEQVAAAATVVSDLLAACTEIKILVTSRVVLHVYGEHDVAVPPLAVPSARGLGGGGWVLEERDHANPQPPTPITQYAAVRLFIERAQAAKADFTVTNENAPAVAEICARLDGLPLAIELAAARIRLLPPQALLARLERRLTLLTGGARDLPARQQTLRDAIAWSYDLLTPEEQRVFRRLAVFSGGCTLEAAEAVCAGPEPPSRQGRGRDGAANLSPLPSREGGPPGLGIDVLDSIASLVDKSLLRQEEGPDGEPRFVMLETIREFAAERLDASGEGDVLRARHAAYFCEMAERASPAMTTAQRSEWGPRLTADLDNLRAALVSSEAAGDLRTLGRLINGLFWFWAFDGRWSEAHSAISRMLTWVVAGAVTDPAVLAWIYLGAGAMAWYRGNLAEARPHLDTALEYARAAGDRHVEGYTQFFLSLWALYRGDFAEARERAGVAAAISRDIGFTWGHGMGLFIFGDATVASDPVAAQRAYEQSIAVFRAAGDDWGMSHALTSLGHLAMQNGDYATARTLLEESLAIRRVSGERYQLAISLTTLGEVGRCEGNHEEAQAHFVEALELSRIIGNLPGIAWALHNLGHIALRRGDVPLASAQFREALTLARESGQVPRVAACLAGLAEVAAATGDPTRAARLFAAARSLLDGIQAVLGPADQRSYESAVDSVRAALGDDAFERAWQEGAAMSLDDVIAAAIRDGALA